MKAEDLEFFTNLLGDHMDDGFGREYNLFCCEQGVEIATALETKERIVEFHKMDWEEQKELVPNLSDGHSGNTFSMSCRLAISYLPQLIINKRDDRIETIVK